MSEIADPAALLAHADWLRALARRLVGPSAADDAVQDTYAAALRSPPDAALPARPWLARVLRNVASMGHRARARRARREDLVAVTAPVLAEAPDAAIQRVETFRALVELVLALDEPLRATLVRHYFDGDTLADIARREGVPEGTVRWRHKQAIDQLRARLDVRNAGDRHAWLAALAPLASSPPAHVPALSLGGLVVNKVLIAATLAAAASGIVAWRYAVAPASPPPPPTTAHGAAAIAAASPQVAEHAAASRSVSRDAPPTSAHVRRLASVAERRALAEQIATARARRATAHAIAGAGTPADGESAGATGLPGDGDGDMDKDVIRGAMREALPILGTCYDRARPTLGSDHLAIHAHLTLTGDPDIGTIVDADQLVDDDGHPVATALDDCLRSTFQTLELPPLPDGAKVDVNYPLLFADGPPPS